MIGVEEANDIYPEVLLEPYNITLCPVENLVAERVNHSLMIKATAPPLEYLDR